MFAHVVPHLFGEQISGMSGVLFNGLVRHLEPLGLSAVVWSSGSVLIMWLTLWILYRHEILWRA
jgi:hypothetical protein